jgi:hypothetical protein
MEAGEHDEVEAHGKDVLMRRPVLGTLVLALALAGCGGSGGGGGGAKAVSGEAIAAAAAKSSRPGSVEADFKIAGAGIDGSGTGVFNTGESRSGQLSMKVRVRGVSVPIDSVITGNVLYLRSSLFSQIGLSGNKQWVKVDLAQLAQQKGIDLSSLATASPTPTSVLAYLRGAGHVEKVGTDSVQGVSTTHYKVTVDLERAAAQASGGTRESLRRVIQVGGVKKLPVDVWIDGDDFLRKVEYAQPAGNGGAVHLSMELHDFGRPITVKPPPADSVVDLMKSSGNS